MIVLLLAAAFLCGVPFGFIVGLVAVWYANRPARGEDVDYSGGV